MTVSLLSLIADSKTFDSKARLDFKGHSCKMHHIEGAVAGHLSSVAAPLILKKEAGYDAN